MAYLYTDSDLTECVYVNDMNPETRDLLETNMNAFDKKRDADGTYVVGTMDARLLASSLPETQSMADVLLVNLPHDGIEHLPYLLPLLSNGQALLCGWSIIEKSETETFMNALKAILHAANRKIESDKLDIVKGFSATKSMVRYECILFSKTNR